MVSKPLPRHKHRVYKSTVILMVLLAVVLAVSTVMAVALLIAVTEIVPPFYIPLPVYWFKIANVIAALAMMLFPVCAVLLAITAHIAMRAQPGASHRARYQWVAVIAEAAVLAYLGCIVLLGGTGELF